VNAAVRLISFPENFSMKRPTLLNLLPDSFKERAFYKLYNHRQADYAPLFQEASLRFSPGARLFDLLPGDVISGMIALAGFYELALTRRIVSLAKSGGLFVDVGANLGYFSILWASLNPKSKSICFEASPRNIESINNNVKRNSLSDRVTLVPKAAGKELGSVQFDVGPSAQTGWGGIANSKSTTSIEVPLTRLDHEISDQTIDVLKVDVEGADTWVLIGCERLLREKRIRQIFFEQNTYRMELLGIRAGEAQEFLQNLGYTCAPRDRDGGEWEATP
jgi:FkbM family methyltransferase